MSRTFRITSSLLCLLAFGPIAAFDALSGAPQTAFAQSKRNKSATVSKSVDTATPAASTAAAAAPPAVSTAEATGGATTNVAADVIQSMDTTPPQRIAVTSFEINGENIMPALRYQLQDGFVLGLVRNGVNVIDLEELSKRIADEPELLGCDSSPCLKRLGEMVNTRYVVRIEINADGNSYRMIARVYRTTGAAPAALPIETQSRFCDVCTVTEAREAMIRLADGVRVPDEPDLLGDQAKKVVVVRQENRLSYRTALITMGAGLAAIVGGTLWLATSDFDAKGTHAMAGGLMGLGAGTAVFGLYEAYKERKH
ncbi:MAG: hypothetical protein SGI86_16950 [Deltaproteobacteria bacterium]|nr:hypothetical protein [Deltaproteobacteria bacterium]